MAEIAFEAFAAALEATRGTAVTPPTHYFPLVGSITPETSYYEPQEARGTLFRRYRQQRVRDAATWTAEGGADPRYLPFMLNLITGAGVITTPTNGVLTRLHTHKPSGTTDAIKTATLYFGDPNVQIWQSDFAYANEFTISADASGTDGATMTIGGNANPMIEVATPTFPAQTIGSLLIPGTMQIWMDTSSAIGTTELTGRLISADLTINNGVVSKFLAGGPTGGTTYSRIGRGRPEVSSTFQMEVPDTTQMDLMLAATSVKVRIKISGDQIEAVTPTYYEAVSWDVFGKLKFDGWGELEGTNRTATFRIDSIYDSTLGADYQVQVYNQSGTV